MRPAWFPDWSGEICAIVASGPSVTQENVDKLRGKCRVGVVNNGHELAPWADVLYAADRRWWECFPAALSFAGLKITAGVKENMDFAKRYDLKLAELVGDIDKDTDSLIGDPDGSIGRGGNGAFQLSSLFIAAGCRQMIWIGFDLTGEHWHGKHPEPLKNPRANTLEKWARRFDAQAPALTRAGIEIINCSDISVLTAYPKMNVDEAFARWGIR